MRAGLAIATALGTTLLVDCASKPPINTQLLEQARTEVTNFSNNPSAQQMASAEFAQSRSSLSQADDALKENRQSDVDYHSYMAIRQAQTGEARIAEQAARQQLVQAKSDREKIVLEARNAELEAKNKLAAQQTERGMVLTLSGVLFDTGKATLKPGATPTLDRVSSYMSQFPKTRLRIEGHTDNTGSTATNEELSHLRAQTVADALVSRGVPRNRLDITGLGPEMPVASNATAEGRQQNRRVEMVFSDDAGRFAQGATTGVHR
jgi:outer membrane protein OmpA-like peptidoglycan-associated protein